jgi:hypothetical protein
MFRYVPDKKTAKSLPFRLHAWRPVPTGYDHVCIERSNSHLQGLESVFRKNGGEKIKFDFERLPFFYVPGWEGRDTYELFSRIRRFGWMPGMIRWLQSTLFQAAFVW